MLTKLSPTVLFLINLSTFSQMRVIFNAELENESDVRTWKPMKRNDHGLPIFGWRYKSHKISARI
jgi:hypothetical protein